MTCLSKIVTDQKPKEVMDPHTILKEVKRLQEMGQENHKMIEKLKKMVNVYSQSFVINVAKFQEIIQLTDCIESVVISKYIPEWKTNQSMGRINNLSIDTLQHWCEILAQTLTNVLMDCGHAIYRERLMNRKDNVDAFMEIEKDAQVLASNLAMSSLIIVKQPPQVVVKHLEWGTTVRLLTGPYFVDNWKSNKMKVTLETEKQLAHIDEFGTKSKDYASGKLKNNKVEFTYDIVASQYTANFNKLIINERPLSTDNSDVATTKYGLHYEIPLTVRGRTYIATATSLPICIIDHASQEMRAWATILWDSAFKSANRSSFSVNQHGSWYILANALSSLCELQCGRGIDRPAEQLSFLLPQRVRHIQLADVTITFDEFCNQTMVGYDFTLWEWFYQTVYFCRDHLRLLWNHGHLIGFVTKERAETLLHDCNPGTFLLRFSQSQPGSLCISVVVEDKIVKHLYPYDKEDMVLGYLGQAVESLCELKTLYPNKPKEILNQYQLSPKLPKPSSWTGIKEFNLFVKATIASFLLFCVYMFFGVVFAVEA